jgi:anti-anti-sigma factor
MSGLKPFTIEKVGDVEIVRLTEPKMSQATLESLQKALAKSIEAGTRKMLINLEPLTFVDSFGIGVIAATARKMGQAGGELRLCGVGERVLMSLTITRLDRTLAISADEAEALRRFRGEA